MEHLKDYLSNALSDWHVWIAAGLFFVGGLVLSLRFSRERQVLDSLSDLNHSRSVWPVVTLIILLLILLGFIGLKILS